jgi:hypothetical protein
VRDLIEERGEAGQEIGADQSLLRVRREPRAHLSQKGRGVLVSGHAVLWNLSCISLNLT